MPRRRLLILLGAASIAVAGAVTTAAAAGRRASPRTEPVGVTGYRAGDGVEYFPTISQCGGSPVHEPQVEDTPAAVTIRLRQAVTPWDGPCPAMAEIGLLVVTLAQPPGDRDLVDAATGTVVRRAPTWTSDD